MRYRWVLLLVMAMFVVVFPVGANPAAVMISFDDAWPSVYENATPIFTSHGMNATFYVIPEDVGEPNRVTVSELTEMQTAGWDIASHAQHSNLRTLTLEEQTAELQSSIDDLEAWGFTRASHHLSFPLGEYDENTTIAMDAVGMLSGRTVLPFPMNITSFDMLHLYGVTNVNETNNYTALKEDISALNSNNVVFLFSHGCDVSPYITAAQLDDLLQYCEDESIPVLSITEFYNQYKLDNQLLVLLPTVDGYTYRNSANSTYTSLRDGVGNGVNSVDTNFLARINTVTTTEAGKFARLTRGILSFNRSSLPADAVIKKAILYLEAVEANKYTGMGNFTLAITNGSLNSNTSLQNGDYQLKGSLELTPRIPDSDIMEDRTGFNAIEFNSTGITYISENSNVILFVVTGDDVDGTFSGSWASNAKSGVSIASKEHLTTIYDSPRLEIQYATPPISNFTGTPLSGCTPISVQFTDASTIEEGTIINWSWDFGDGYTSFDQNPLHIYNYSGTYDVNLTVTNSADTTSYLNRTSYVNGTYTSNFSANATGGIPPLAVAFTDSSCNTTAGWYWEFGDGDANTTQNPTYTYDDVIGNLITSFNVSLNSTNGFEYDWENKTAYITLYPLNTDFTGVPTSGSNPLTVSFTSAITNGTATTWDWDFGDGSPHSTLENPSHTYTSNGDYTVSLNASNTYSYDWENKTIYISVSSPGAPTANFHGTPTSGTVPLTVTFFDDSTGSPTSWNWSFGDGQFSTLQNPSHIYSSVGTYTVSLNATNAFGSDVAQANDYIAVTAAPTPTQTPSNATGGTRGYSAEETAIPFWLWAVIIILGSALLIAGLFGRHLIFGIMSTMCFAAAAFASPMVSFFYQEVVLSNESEVAYSVFPMKWLVTQPWVAWLLWGMALLALLVVVYGVIVGMAEIKKPGDEFLEDDWLDRREF